MASVCWSTATSLTPGRESVSRILLLALTLSHLKPNRSPFSKSHFGNGSNMNGRDLTFLIRLLHRIGTGSTALQRIRTYDIMHLLCCPKIPLMLEISVDRRCLSAASDDRSSVCFMFWCSHQTFCWLFYWPEPSLNSHINTLMRMTWHAIAKLLTVSKVGHWNKV